jgi:DNA-directed RNA polymerase specialized sigma24 family protein
VQDDGDVNQALEALVRRYAALVRSVVARVGGAAMMAAADDIAQQVFVSVWQQIRREQDIRHPASYIYKAAIRETVAMRQSLARELPCPYSSAVTGRTPSRGC